MLEPFVNDLIQDEKSLRDLYVDAIRSRSAALTRLSWLERNVEEHNQTAQLLMEEARQLKSNIAAMDYHLTKSWDILLEAQIAPISKGAPAQFPSRP